MRSVKVELGCIHYDEEIFMMTLSEPLYEEC